MEFVTRIITESILVKFDGFEYVRVSSSFMAYTSQPPRANFKLENSLITWYRLTSEGKVELKQGRSEQLENEFHKPFNGK